MLKETPMTRAELVEIIARQIDPFHWTSHPAASPHYQEIARERAKTLLTALSASGLAIVPTEAGERAGGAALDYPSVYMGGPRDHSKRSAKQAYRAMVAAEDLTGERG